eukprot:3605475-Prymnesium_polylepis.2
MPLPALLRRTPLTATQPSVDSSSLVHRSPAPPAPRVARRRSPPAALLPASDLSCLPSAWSRCRPRLIAAALDGRERRHRGHPCRSHTPQYTLVAWPCLCCLRDVT